MGKCRLGVLIIFWIIYIIKIIVEFLVLKINSFGGKILYINIICLIM